jgi:pyrimidine operon attenuation protein/uracil phosphoribosyltransferase
MYLCETSGKLMSQKLLLNANELQITLHRLACQLIENHDNFKNTALIGLQPRGSFLLRRLEQILVNDYGIKDLKTGLLDITFYRDDFRRSNEPLKANSTDIPFVVENTNVVIVDDVLYTGRSIRAALTALQSFGRPSSIELLTLIDRRFSRHLPIQPDYNGRQVDAIGNQKVRVSWMDNDGEDAVYLIKNEQ